MTRYKRRMIKGIVKSCVLVTLPVLIAAGTSGASGLKRALSSAGRLDIGQTPGAETAHEEQAETSVYTKTVPAPEDVLAGEMILSEGYGIAAETEGESRYLHLASPIDMITSDPGEKPYPSEWGSGGSIVRTTYGEYSGTTYFDLDGGGQVNNKTDISNETLLSESRCLPNFTVDSLSEPLVLIYHTHTTESFEPFVREDFDPSFNYRTTDSTKNVVMVGDAIQAELEAQGIGVIHAYDIHDYPSYNGSYDRSRETIVPILEQYPSIKVVLDIHRDAISSEGVAYQPFIEVDGKEAAQIMIISGCDDGTLGMPDYMKNFHFACALQQKLESDTPGFTRPILFDYRHYNQDLTTGSLLIEVGTHGNTLEQVQYSGQIFGKSLGEFLVSMEGK